MSYEPQENKPSFIDIAATIGGVIFIGGLIYSLSFWFSMISSKPAQKPQATPTYLSAQVQLENPTTMPFVPSLTYTLIPTNTLTDTLTSTPVPTTVPTQILSNIPGIDGCLAAINNQYNVTLTQSTTLQEAIFLLAHNRTIGPLPWERLDDIKDYIQNQGKGYPFYKKMDVTGLSGESTLETVLSIPEFSGYVCR
jgi:hypothetical protein